MEHPHVGYTGKTQQYTNGRPSYPAGVLDFILTHYAHDSVVADIGAGTGIFTELLAEHFLEVYAVEPDKDMRSVLDAAAKKMGNITSSESSAESTGLADHSIDVVCVAQAFHWFNVPAFRKEMQRILRPNGRVFIIHNVPPQITTSVTLNKDENPASIQEMLAKRKEDRRAFFGSDLDFAAFDNSLTYDKDRYTLYFLSLSTGPDMQDEKKVRQLTEDIGNEFDKISKDGRVILPFVTEIYTTKGSFK